MKRLLALLIATVIVASFYGCGSTTTSKVASQNLVSKEVSSVISESSSSSSTAVSSLADSAAVSNSVSSSIVSSTNNASSKWKKIKTSEYDPDNGGVTSCTVNRKVKDFVSEMSKLPFSMVKANGINQNLMTDSVVMKILPGASIQFATDKPNSGDDIDANLAESGDKDHISVSYGALEGSDMKSDNYNFLSTMYDKENQVSVAYIDNIQKTMQLLYGDSYTDFSDDMKSDIKDYINHMYGFSESKEGLFRDYVYNLQGTSHTVKCSSGVLVVS
jgi:cytoskeletal protein RodZ